MDSRYLVSATAVTFASAAFVTGTPALGADPVKPKAAVVVAPAPNPLSGYVQAFIGVGSYHSIKYSGGSFSDGFHILGGAAAANLWLAPNRSLQLDVYGTGETKFAVALHHTHRNGAAGLWGLMVSVGDGGGNSWTGDVAIEAQMYHGPNGMTLYGQAGLIANSNSQVGAYGAAQARWFPMPDTEFSVDASVGTLYGDIAAVFGAQVEKKMAGLPVSAFARVQYDIDSYRPYGKDTAASVMLGMSFLFNQLTLQAMSLNGATLLDLNPIFGRYASFSW